jgi:N-acetylglucosaminyl-diphospho-decaprenol L-rhamnosyltransferase
MKPMPVALLVSYSGALGGAERVLVEFAAGLKGERWLACPEGPLAAAARDVGIGVRPMAAGGLRLRGSLTQRGVAAGRLAAHGLEARAAVRDLSPDLLIACGMRSGLSLLLAGRPEVPLIFMHNDMLPGPLIAAAVRRAAARADLVIVPSQAVAEDLGVSPAPLVVHPGVEVGAFADLGEAQEPPVMLVLGALVPWKRPGFALEVCARARRSLPELVLRFVGAPLEGGALMDELGQRARAPDLAGAVEFAGSVPDPRPELARASCLLHCAEREPFGLVVAEAMAAGRPVIVPADAGPAEIADARCGIFYPPGDVDACARAVVDVAGDRRRALAMGKHGRERVQEHFGAARMREELATAAAQVLRPPSGGVAESRRQGVDLTLVTVTHNSARELRALLVSVERFLPQARVLVVDCASDDASVDVAQRASPRVAVVALDENVGFGAACNLGLAEVRGRATALVNPDVEFLDDSLAPLAAEALRNDLPPRLLAPLVLGPGGSRQDTVHPRPASLPEVVGAFVPLPLVPGAAPWRARAPRRVGWAVGCALVARTETLRALGPFDSRIFMYGEDLELGLRAAEAGIATWFWPSSRILHHGAHSTTPAFGGEPFERLASARRDVVGRRYGRRRTAVDDAVQAVTFATRIAAKRLLGRSAARERRQLEALRSARRAR